MSWRVTASSLQRATTAAMPMTRRASGLTGNPAFPSWSSVADWVAAGHGRFAVAPSTNPIA